MSQSDEDGARLGRAFTTGNMSAELPPLAAAFLVEFDVRKGYSLIWQRSVKDAQLEGVVEYKSLPSGLHNVEEDLIYFVHDAHAGLSAFLHRASEESQRNTLMLAVGILVPLSYGRLGKSWRHAQYLRDLVRQIIRNPDRTDELEEYWDKYKFRQDTPGLDGTLDSPLSFKDPSTPQKVNGTTGHKRRLSDTTAVLRSSHVLASDHPALSLSDLIATFGPLIFPLYKSALLRKRILILREPPVQSTCDFVYGLSILASIPQALTQFLPYGKSSHLLLRPLFNVGIHDIPYLTEKAQEPDASWIACTTDGVLATKPTLFDILVRLPASNSSTGHQKSHPTILPSNPSLSHSFHRQPSLKSTQRDARRYITLRTGLSSLPSGRPSEDAATDSDAASSTPSTFSTTSTYSSSSIVEPISWPQVAYTSFMWWASAGENATAGEQEAENEQDSGLLLADLDADEGLDNVYRVPSRIGTDNVFSGVTKEMALVSYFHRLTTVIFTTIADAIARESAQSPRPRQRRRQGGSNNNHPTSSSSTYYDEDLDHSASPSDPDSDSDASSSSSLDDESPLLSSQPSSSEPATVDILPEDLTRMGLDVWSAADRAFVEELVGVWWGRKARVRAGEVRCCGVKLL